MTAHLRQMRNFRTLEGQVVTHKGASVGFSSVVGQAVAQSRPREATLATGAMNECNKMPSIELAHATH